MTERPADQMPCDVVKRSVMIAGHATSVTLERAFWLALKQIAKTQSLSMNALITEIDVQNKGRCNLSSALRVYVLNMLTLPDDKAI